MILNYLKKIYNAIQAAQIKRGVRIVQERMMNYKVYRQTYTELNKLSDNELKDIGISRGMIHSIAMEAYFDSRVHTNENLRNWV